jgi:hypothetical protein
MSYRPNPADKSWSACINMLADVFAKWGIRNWGWECPASNGTMGGGRSHWAGRTFPEPSVRGVTVRFQHQTGDRVITVSKFGRPVDNLWAIQLGLDAIRLNEQRGLDDVAREFYQALPAPATQRDPYEVLGIRSDTSIEVAEAAYRALAKSAHPDAGGSEERMKELNEAITAVRA